MAFAINPRSYTTSVDSIFDHCHHLRFSGADKAVMQKVQGHRRQ